ncbi:DNA replication ATP-dependent helicase/nuclease JHS1 isoform X4 [Primulina eburnea]|uniref:DNA replication ATP-dependent helicase/nuclease JHS1 isoform X4 n=1 Tax=Primulina eburnea TaxID=1245227 RepID=UPI003C6BED03
MAPRKKNSSGLKKSTNQNHQPSQPSKFGIQHFFDRHSQTQKILTQNNNNAENHPSNFAPPPIPSHQTNGNYRGMDTSEKIVSMGKILRGENLTSGLSETGISGSNFSSCIDVESGDADSACEKGVIDSQSLKNGDTLQDIEVDDMSPETSKSMSVKRFKFSPGMLIKQSQDDIIDEMTWRISPVNERLHAITKHPPGKIRVLGDSSRFNSLNFQQCSMKKMQTSPGMSRKLEKLLSAQPLKAAEKSLMYSNIASSRKVNSARDARCTGSCENTNNNINSEELNTQSPFTTPPSMSCCQGKVPKDVDSNGIPDHMGSWKNKKALIELLDQVEDVISVDPTIPKDRETSIGTERSFKADHVVNRLTHDSGGKKCNMGSDVCFLVLEVTERHRPADLLAPQTSFKVMTCQVLHLLNEQSGVERTLQLWDEWYFSVIAPGDTINVIGEFDCQGICDVNRDKNFLIVHPDNLVSGTRVSSSFSCPRRTVLDERLKYSEHSAAALMGTLLHQIFQAGLVRELPTKEFLEEYARTVLQKSIENLYACGVNENDTLMTLISAIPKMLNWICRFRDSQGSQIPSINFKCDEGLKKVKISEVIDIEEMAWAPKYGLKGMIDASLRVRIDLDSAEDCEIIMPLEFKTGRGTSGQIAMEHTAQVMLYSLLMSERYQRNVEYGLLYYLHTDQTQGIFVRRSDLTGLIMRRNELANDIRKASSTQQLPPMSQSPNICKGCRHLSACTVYHKAYGGAAESSGLGGVFDSLVSHLSTSHIVFLQKWERLIDLEAKQLEVVKNEIWFPKNSENDRGSIRLSPSLVLDASDKSSQRKFCQGSRFVYCFVRQGFSLDDEQVNKEPLSFSSSLDTNLRNGDYVILSSEPGYLRVANGIIVDIGSSHISVSFAKRLKVPDCNPDSAASLNQQSWRIDKDEVMTSFAIMRFNLIQLFLQNENSSRLRKMIVDLEMPRFDSGCVYSQDPAISYVWNEKSLNDDQRRAIIKILIAKDYALILGMPGTGKTSTMVHAVKALLMRGASILLTSYTNSAVDNLLIKLKAQGINFIRIGRYEAVHEEVKENCLSAVDMDSIHEIKSKLDETHVVAVTCLGITSPLLNNKRFDVCIMDEAGQITFPVSLGPLMFASKFVLVGDHYQLPPLVQSPEAKENGMVASLFSRLSEAHPQAIAALHCQYRMSTAIMELSNALIYGNRLVCGSPEIGSAKLRYKRSLSAPVWLMKVLEPNQPVIFINTDLLPAYEKNDCKAVNNPIEANIIAEVTKSLVLRGIEGRDIGIITPYNSQTNRIRGVVSEPVEIHTIDKYQGRDKDCILVSFVRSSETPRNNNSSLLGDWHRINVALTRAKKKLIMVGSSRTLSEVPLLCLLIKKVEELSGFLVVTKEDVNYKTELKRCSQFR